MKRIDIILLVVQLVVLFFALGGCATAPRLGAQDVSHVQGGRR